MSVRTTAARPAGRTVGAAFAGALFTLTVFAVTVVAFVLAPLLLLGLGLLAYLVLRPRTARTPSAPATIGPSAHAFGAGAGPPP